MAHNTTWTQKFSDTFVTVGNMYVIKKERKKKRTFLKKERTFLKADSKTKPKTNQQQKPIKHAECDKDTPCGRTGVYLAARTIPCQSHNKPALIVVHTCSCACAVTASLRDMVVKSEQRYPLETLT